MRDPAADTLAELTTSVRPIPRAEHVGSLVRPRALIDELRRLGLVSHGEITDVHAQIRSPKPTPEQLEELHLLEDRLIREAVVKQQSIGLDAVTDGEFRRLFFTGSFDTAVTGFEPSATLVNFYNDEGVAFQTTERPRVAERLKIVANPLAEEARFLKDITDHRFKVTLPAASLFQWPGTFTRGVTDRVYRDHDELADHVVTLLRQLIEGAIDAGARYIQCDFPLYPLFVDKHHHQPRWRAVGIEDDEQYLDRMIRVDRAVVDGLPADVTTAIHICRGNTADAWLAEGSLDPVAERMFNELPYDRFLLELDDKPHQGDYSQLRYLPKGKIVVLGIVSSQTLELESEDELMREIEDATRYVDIDQLALSPQCGFASLADWAEMEPSTEDSQWRKLELLSRVADRVWPK